MTMAQNHVVTPDATNWSFQVPQVRVEVVAFVTAPTVRRIVANPFDRLDLIARRVYPDVSLSEGIRMLIWANATGPLGKRILASGRRVYQLPLVFRGGELLNAPPYEAGDYGNVNPLTPYNTPPPGVTALPNVPAVDGQTGDVAVDRQGALPYLTQLGLTRRLNTDFGRQLMRPDYGLRVDLLVGRPFSEVPDIEAAVRAGLVDLEGVETNITATTTREGRVNIQVSAEVADGT